MGTPYSTPRKEFKFLWFISLSLKQSIYVYIKTIGRLMPSYNRFQYFKLSKKKNLWQYKILIIVTVIDFAFSISIEIFCDMSNMFLISVYS